MKVRNRWQKSGICKKAAICFLAACLFLTACSGSGSQSQAGLPENDTETLSDRWKQGFATSGQNSPLDLSDAKALYHTVHRASTATDQPDIDFSDWRKSEAYSDGEMFSLQSYRTEDGWDHYLQRYDITGETPSPAVQVFQEEALQGHFDRLCFLGENELAGLFVSEGQEGDPQEIRVLTFDKEGKETSRILLDYTYQEIASGPMMSFMNFLCDENYFYLINCYEGGLLVFDREGKEIRRDMPDPSNGRYYTAACSAPDGSVIASRVDLDNKRTELFLLQGKKEERLGEIPDISQRIFAFDEHGFFYYLTDSWLMRWDTATGEQTPLLDCALEGVNPTFLAALTFSVNGRVLLHSWNNEKLEILTCSEEEPEQGESSLSLAVVEEYPGLYFRSLPADYSKNHPDNPIELETYEGDFETYHTRLMADILNGGGPDILLLSTEDVRNLYENDALLDLTEYMDPELKNEIFPSVLQKGMIDGKLIGLDTSIQGTAMLASNAAWEGDSWTIEDIIRLVDEKKPKDLFAYNNWGTIENSPDYLLYFFLSDFLDRTPFLNLEAGTCDFENETFIRFLEICKEYGEKPALQEDQIYEELKTGECLATCVSVFDIGMFSEGMKPLEKTCHPVGYPGQDGYGSTGSYRLLVINANTKNLERSLEFLWDLLSLEEQQKLLDGTSVREDVIRASVKEKGTAPGLTDHAGYVASSLQGFAPGSYKLLETKEDGSSFVEEFITVLKGLELGDGRVNAVYSIVEEEAEPFFEGSKSAEEAAKIIQNRIQLYLDESK